MRAFIQAQRMSLEQRQPGIMLWLLWMCATGGGALAGGIVQGLAFWLPDETMRLIGIVLGGLITGIMTGVSQSLVLGYYLSGFRWRRWLLANGAAGVLIVLVAFIIIGAVTWGFGQGLASQPQGGSQDGAQAVAGGWGRMIFETILFFLLVIAGAVSFGLILGAVIGFTQWQVLRRHIPPLWGTMRLWVGVSALAGLLSFLLGFVSAIFLSLVSAIFYPHLNAGDLGGFMLQWMTGLFTGGLIFGAVTGSQLLSLLKEPVVPSEAKSVV